MMNTIQGTFTGNIIQQTVKGSNADRGMGFEKGQILSGNIVSRDDQWVTVETSTGDQFRAAAADITGQVGDALLLEVKDVNNNGVVMKQLQEDEEVKEQKAEESGESEDKLKDWKKGAILPPNLDIITRTRALAQSQMEKHAKLAQAVQKIKKDLTHAVQNVNRSAVSLLTENGVSIDKMALNMVSEAIKATAGSGSQTATDDEIMNAAQQFAQDFNEADAQEKTEAIEALMREGAAVSESNIAALETVKNQLKEIQNADRVAALNLLHRGERPTVENMFKAIHSGNGPQIKPLANESWQELLPTVEKFLQDEGFELNPENYERAKLLIESELSLTSDHMKLLDNSNYRQDIKALLKEAAAQLLSGESAGDIALLGQIDAVIDETAIVETYGKIMAALPEITDHTISFVLRSQQPVTLTNLLAAHEKGEADDFAEPAAEDIEKKMLTQKRQLEELRLKFTVEAASRLLHRGIRIDTAPLRDAVSALREQERQMNASHLKMAGAQATDSQVTEVGRILDHKQQAAKLDDIVIGDIHSKRIAFTMEAMDTASSAKGRMAADTYDALLTRVDGKFGDGFGKVADQIKPLLSDLGMDDTPENVHSARILVRTGSEVTEESIENVKTILAKIDALTQGLHPLVAAHMVRDGFNPLNRHIDESLAYIREYEAQYGQPPSERIEEAIYEMDKNNALTKEERASVVALYRMVHTIENNETAAAGILNRNDMALTLENLLDASDYFSETKGKWQSIDAKIDDTTGMAEVHRPDNNIRERLDKAFGQAVAASDIDESSVRQILSDANYGETADNANRLQSLKDNDLSMDGNGLNRLWQTENGIRTFEASVDPSAFLSMPQGLATQPLETLLDNQAQSSLNLVNESETQQRFIEQMQQLDGVSPQIIEWMTNTGLTPTLDTIKTVNSIAGDDNHFANTIEDIEQMLDDDGQNPLSELIQSSDLELLKDGMAPSELLLKIQQAAEEIRGKAVLSKEDLSAAKALSSQAQNAAATASLLQNTLSDENFYQLPVKVGGQIENLSVYVVNENAQVDNMSVWIKIDSTVMGKVEGMIQIDSGHARIQLTGNDDQAASLMEKNRGLFDSLMAASGFTEYDVSFTAAPESNFIAGQTANQAEARVEHTGLFNATI